MDDLPTDLRRLAKAVSLVSEALEELSVALEAAEGLERDAYRRVGHPFGHSPAGRSIWRGFGGRTTLN